MFGGVALSERCLMMDRVKVACAIFCLSLAWSCQKPGRTLYEKGDAPMISQEPVFVAGTQGYHTYRIPALAVTDEGTVLAFCEARKNSRADHGDIDLVLRRSADHGASWSDMQIIWDQGEHTVGNPAPVVDRQTGVVWLLLCLDNDKVFVTSSTDDGQTWASPREITSSVKPSGWSWYATGPVHGIQLRTGRLLIPCDHRDKGDPNPMHSHVVFSDDHGATWKLGGIPGPMTDECVAAETKDGRVYLNMWSYHGQHRRAVSWSHDSGGTWSEVELDQALVEPVCQASCIQLPQPSSGQNELFLFSNPASETRLGMAVRVSRDGCKTWSKGKVLHPGPSAYSDLAVARDGTILCLYERGDGSPYEGITLARFNTAWLEVDAP